MIVNTPEAVCDICDKHVPMISPQDSLEWREAQAVKDKYHAQKLWSATFYDHRMEMYVPPLDWFEARTTVNDDPSPAPMSKHWNFCSERCVMKWLQRMHETGVRNPWTRVIK